MDFVRSYFDTNEPLTSWTLLSSLFFQISTDQHWSGKKVKTKVFNWSEVHLYRSNFLQNPYFRFLHAIYLGQVEIALVEIALYGEYIGVLHIWLPGSGYNSSIIYSRHLFLSIPMSTKCCKYSSQSHPAMFIICVTNDELATILDAKVVPTFIELPIICFHEFPIPNPRFLINPRIFFLI